MRWGGKGFVAACVLLLTAVHPMASAQPREETETEFNERARAQEEAYRRQWEAERAALQAQSPPPQASEGDIDSDSGGSGMKPPETTPDEAAGLVCINANRASVELPALSLEEFRAGRAAGMIADPVTLCDDGSIAPTDLASDYSAPDLQVNTNAPPNNDVANTLVIAFLIFCALAYFAPTAIAFKRSHQYRWVIAAFNLVTGWTGVGWIWLFVWSIWPRNRALASPIIDDATGIGRPGG